MHGGCSAKQDTVPVRVRMPWHSYTCKFVLCKCMMQALAAVPVGFLRIIGFVLFWLMSRLAATERAKARLWQRQIQKYGPVVCTCLFALCLAHTHQGGTLERICW